MDGREVAGRPQAASDADLAANRAPTALTGLFTIWLSTRPSVGCRLWFAWLAQVPLCRPFATCDRGHRGTAPGTSEVQQRCRSAGCNS